MAVGELEADSIAAQEAAGFGHYCLLLRDQAALDRVAAPFADRGWAVLHGLVMAARREPERQVDISLAVEVGLEALRETRMAAMPPWGTPEVRAQMLDAKHGIAERVTVRCFAVVVDGEVASSTDLYLDGDVAQVEDVATDERHRGKGYASAVVLRAVEEARAAGADLVFLVTDSDDWPHELYRRLGFDELGRYVKLARPPTSARPA